MVYMTLVYEPFPFEWSLCHVLQGEVVFNDAMGAIGGRTYEFLLSCLSDVPTYLLHATRECKCQQLTV